MKEQNNATCSICGRPYHLCISCRDSMKLQPWKIHCCSSECYKTFQIVKGFNNGIYTKEEAKEKFKNVDLGNLGAFVPHIKKIVEDILKEEKIEEPIIVESVIEIEPAIIEEIKEVEKVEEEVSAVFMANPSRKKKFKVEVE